ICLDAEIMPWSAKAQELLKLQYALTGSAAKESLAAAVRLLARQPELLMKFENRLACIDRYIDAYARYCWNVRGVNDLKIAPFHVLATERRIHSDKNHVWHMEKLAQLCSGDADLLFATPFKVVNVSDSASQQEGIEWWLQLTETGGEGMVVKP